MSWIGDDEIPLIVTSWPYFDVMKEYEHAPGQLAEFRDYSEFLDKLDVGWRECYRVLAPGGRLACNVGDVLRSRKAHGSHHVLPLHADILVRSRHIGLEVLNGVLWSKRTNCAYEQGGAGMLGQRYMPRSVIKSEIEHILLFKKPGPCRSPTPAQRNVSRIAKEDYGRGFARFGMTCPALAQTIATQRRSQLRFLSV